MLERTGLGDVLSSHPYNRLLPGVVPDASLVCYSVGEVAFVTAAVTAYDHLLDHAREALERPDRGRQFSTRQVGVAMQQGRQRTAEPSGAGRRGNSFASTRDTPLSVPPVPIPVTQ